MKNKGYAKFGWGSWGGGGGGGGGGWGGVGGGGGGGRWARSVMGDVKMMVNFLRASNH